MESGSFESPRVEYMLPLLGITFYAKLRCPRRGMCRKQRTRMLKSALGVGPSKVASGGRDLGKRKPFVYVFTVQKTSDLVKARSDEKVMTKHLDAHTHISDQPVNRAI